MRTCARWFLLLCCAAAPACGKQQPAGAQQPNVLVLVLDSVRPDYLSAYDAPKPTSPFLKRFAATATRYERASTTSSWALPAHASLFSGTPPAFHRATQATEHVAADVPLLAERLKSAGYQTAAFTNNGWISKATGLDRGFELLQDQWNLRERRRSAGATHPTVQALKEWFERQRKPGQPFFVFVNLTDAHMPYLPSWEEARDFFASTGAWEAACAAFFPDAGATLLARNYGAGQPLDETELELLRNLYRGSLRRTDAISEALLALVDANSDPAKTLVFVLSDHGESLGEHGHLGHLFNLYETSLRIALLARGPGFAPGAKDARPVQITDLYPTILLAAGLQPEPVCTGLDLHGELPAQRVLCASLETPLLAFSCFPRSTRDSGLLTRFERTLEYARSGAAVQILAGDGSAERYDLEQDPGQLNVLPALPGAAERATSEAIAGTLAAWKARAASEVKGHATTDDKTRAALKHLGYLAGDD